jgi:hypothetical protein
MYWVHLLTIKLFNNQHYRRIRFFVLLFHSSIIFVQIYMYITVFDADFFFQYIITFLSLLAVSNTLQFVTFFKCPFQAVMFNASYFISEKNFNDLENTIYSHFWSPSTATQRAREDIKRDTRYVTILVLLNTFLGIFAGIVLIPVGKSVDHQFGMFLFRTYLPKLHYLLDVIYSLSFAIIGHTMVNWANVVAYYSCLAKSQVKLGTERAKYLSAEYEDQDEDSLYYSEEYQQVMKERIRFTIIRHIELLG